MLAEEDVLAKIIAIVKTKKDEKVLLEKAILALWALCLNNENHQLIVRVNGVIEHLLQLFQTHTTTFSTKNVIMKALASICSSNCTDLLLLFSQLI